MKLVAVYLDHSLAFERIAADEANPTLKDDFEREAAAYRRLAAKRAIQLGLEPTKDPNWTDDCRSKRRFQQKASEC